MPMFQCELQDEILKSSDSSGIIRYNMLFIQISQINRSTLLIFLSEESGILRGNHF
jgi:hypothetical protein